MKRDDLIGRWRQIARNADGIELARLGINPPLARPALTFEFAGDGTFVEEQPGPTDRIEEATGQWTLADDGAVTLEYDSDRPARTLAPGDGPGRMRG